jgi:malonyl-CoA O-methyltransferase
MIVPSSSRKIQKRFSAAAPEYARSATVQSSVARELAARISLRPGEKVLDVGCGTLILSEFLLGQGIPVDIFAVDAAEGMVREARSRSLATSCLVADGCRLPFQSAFFDLVASSSSYQWLGDLAAGFKEAVRVLKPGGMFKAALFGRQTLWELFDSLKEAGVALGRRDLVPVGRLPSQVDVLSAMDQAGFFRHSVEVQMREVVFDDLLSLLRWLKATGTNGLGPYYFGRQLFQEAARYYAEQYGLNSGIKATFEVIWIEGEKDRSFIS